MSHEVTITDLRATGWSVPDFDTVWRGLDPVQVGRFIDEIHADVAKVIAGYEAALGAADEENRRLAAEIADLRVADAEAAAATAAADAAPVGQRKTRGRKASAAAVA